MYNFEIGDYPPIILDPRPPPLIQSSLLGITYPNYGNIFSGFSYEIGRNVVHSYVTFQAVAVGPFPENGLGLVRP